jgi:hypothetical protein
VEIKLHESHRTVDAVIVRVLVFEAAYPGKVRLVEVLSEVLGAMLKHGLRVILVEGPEELDDGLFLLGAEFGNLASLCDCC